MNVAYGRVGVEGAAIERGRPAAAVSPWRWVAPLLAPIALMWAGALVGLAITLDPAVAWQRLIGLLLAGLLATASLARLRHTDNVAPALGGVALMAVLGSGWVIAASGPDVFHGLLSSQLQALFGRLFWSVQLTQPVALTNTWFIVGYNGLADLCLAIVFAGIGILAARQRRPVAMLVVAVVGASTLLLLGTGARGGLAGLAVGMGLVAMVAWRRGWLLAVVCVPVALALAAAGPKSLDISSTTGRFTFWADLVRLLTEFPLTGVGLGLDTAYQVGLLYEINPDPERIAYAHNTFIQSYLEQGPLGALGMVAVPVVAGLALVASRRDEAPNVRARALLLAGVGLVAALEVHGLTDQVVTTNVGTGLLLLGLAAVLASLSEAGRCALGRSLRRLGLGTLLAVVAVLALLVALPGGRARILLNVGGVRMIQGWVGKGAPEQRSDALVAADALLSLALAQDAAQPAAARDLARVRAQRYDDSGAVAALQRATAPAQVDAFDMLQVAHVYRDLGFADEAYAWARRAYATWGRVAADTDPILLTYSRATLHDNPNAQTLADQGEAALRARQFDVAQRLFAQALSFERDSAYLQDRLAAAQRGVDKYGAGR